MNDVNPVSSAHQATRTYALLGGLFGLAFPVFSTLLEAALGEQGLTWAGVVQAQRLPLLWVIDTAPLWLGALAAFAGQRQDALVDLLSEIEQKNKLLRRANEELREASQLKSQFLANMSHELRTPLNAIIGFSRILIKKTADILPERQLKNLKMVHSSGQHLLELVNDILDIERIEAGILTVKESEVEVMSLVDDVVEKLGPAAKDKSLELATLKSHSSVQLRTDAVRLRQLLDNLVNNAIKYSDSGTITLDVRYRPPSHPDEIVFAVHDEGIGISQEQLKIVFNAFQQVDGSSTRAQGGVGLGLHLVKKIAQLLGGDVVAESELGKGSTFTLTLPAGDAAAAAVSAAEEALEVDLAPQGSGPVLLIIDDTPSVIELARTELVEAGFRVHAALGGKDGLKLAREIKPEAILLDIIMPQMDGWAVLKELRSDPEISQTPVVITSQLDNVPKAFDLGIVAWLTKPITAEIFKGVFAQIGTSTQADILVVEDDPSTSSLIVQQLAELGIEARTAADGQLAVDAMAKQLPQAVILDMMLPKKDGFEVLEQLRQIQGGEKVPVVVYTAKDLSEKERERLSGSILDVVSKGQADGLTDLVSKVRQVLASGEPHKQAQP